MLLYPLAICILGAVAVIGRENRVVVAGAGTMLMLTFVGFGVDVGQAVLEELRIQAAETVARNAI